MEVLKQGRPLAVAVLISLLTTSVAARAEDNLEYQVKAAFLFNFLKFVDWPAALTSGPEARWSIGVVGSNDFAGILEETVRGKTVKGLGVIVKRLASLEAGRGCHIVFVAARVKGPIAASPGVLTVGDDPHFLDSGGIADFYLEDGKVRFEIRPESAKSAGLHVSAQLLKLGKMR